VVEAVLMNIDKQMDSGGNVGRRMVG